MVSNKEVDVVVGSLLIMTYNTRFNGEEAKGLTCGDDGIMWNVVVHKFLEHLYF